MRSVESVDMPDPAETSEYDYLQDYSLKITTDKGVCDIIYRNESNGYYSGYLETFDGDYSAFVEVTESN